MARVETVRLMKDLQKILVGRALTAEEREAHEEAGESFHVPAIVHRMGGISAEVLNTCGICGAYIIPGKSPSVAWRAITEAEADKLREAHRGSR